MTKENRTVNASEALKPDFQVSGPNMEARSPSDRLRRAVKAAGGPLTVAAGSGVAISTLQGYLRGGEMKLSNASSLAKATGVNLLWLATGSGPMSGQPEQAPPAPAEPQKSSVPRPIKAARIINHALLASCIDSTKQLFDNAGRSPSTQDIVEVALTLYGDIDEF